MMQADQDSSPSRKLMIKTNLGALLLLLVNKGGSEQDVPALMQECSKISSEALQIQAQYGSICMHVFRTNKQYT